MKQLLIVVLLLIETSCAAPAGVCEGDANCPADEHCLGGVCVAGAPVDDDGDEGEGESAVGEGEGDVGEGEGEEGEGEGEEGEGEEGEGEEGEGEEGEGEGEVDVVLDGESCALPLGLEGASGHESGTSVGYTDQYNARALGNCTGISSLGADIAFFVSLFDGETLDATLTPQDDTLDDVSLYLLEDCVPPNGSFPEACLEGADANDAGGAETLSFRSDRSGSHTYFLIVDSINDDRDYGWALDWSIR